MYSIIYRNTHQTRIGFITLNVIDKVAFYSDYSDAYKAIKDEARHVAPGGMLLLTTLNQKDLESLGTPLPANDPHVVRQYLSQGYHHPIPTSITLRREEINNLKEAISQLGELLINKELSQYGQHTLDSLNTFISQLQDEYVQSGVLRGLIWKDQAYGEGAKEEQKLRLDFPKHAQELGIHFPHEEPQ